MKILQKTILAVLVYHDIFNYPLKEQEIRRFLVQIRNHSVVKGNLVKMRDKFKFSKSQIQNSLKLLQKKEKVVKQDNYYCLSGREGIINLRKRREKYSKEKIKIAEKVVKVLKIIPWIKMIAVTGALAMNNSSKDDDIDFLVITAKNRLWLTRLLMVIVLEILDKRRRPDHKKVKDKICLNMFLDETVLSLSKDKQSLFTAHEIIQMKPIFNKDYIYERFLQSNLWVKNYLPNGVKNLELGSEEEFNTISSMFNILGSKFNVLNSIFLFLEKITYQFQLKHMKSRRTIEKISLHSAFFHPKDRATKILKRYNKSIHNI